MTRNERNEPLSSYDVHDFFKRMIKLFNVDAESDILPFTRIPYMDDFVRGDDDVEKNVQTKDILEKIWAIINEMSPERQKMMKDLYVDDLDIVDIARRDGKRPNTVSKMKHRIISDIKKQLKKKGITYD